jgi:hypothetical protein
MTDPLCARCGRPAGVTLGRHGGYGGYGSTAYDGSRLVAIGADAPFGPVCDGCLAAAELSGDVVAVATRSGLEAPSAIGPRAAAALFGLGTAAAAAAAVPPWVASKTSAVSVRLGGAVATDMTAGDAPLPAWMAASGALWRRFSGGRVATDGAADFESLGVLFRLVAGRARRRGREFAEAVAASLREVGGCGF